MSVTGLCAPSVGPKLSRTAVTGADSSSARTITTKPPVSVRRVSRSSTGRRKPTAGDDPDGVDEYRF